MAESGTGPSPSLDIPRVARKPLYFVIYEAAEPAPAVYVPVVATTSANYLRSATLPHLLDRDLIPALPALWYCLHLPATCFDLQRVPASHTEKMQGFDFSHEIFVTSFESFQAHAGGYSDRLCQP